MVLLFQHLSVDNVDTRRIPFPLNKQPGNLMHKRRLAGSNLPKDVNEGSGTDLVLRLCLGSFGRPFSDVLKDPVSVHPSSNADEVGRVVGVLVLHVDIVVFLVSWGQVFVRALFVLNFKGRFSLLVQNFQLKTVLDYVFASFAKILDLLL